MRLFIVSAALFAVSATAPLSSQAVIQTPTSTIEIIGLKRWTIRMIEDSLARYSPGDTLTGHACAAILRGKLHFADASVSQYIGMNGPDSKKYVAITIVEPQDSARIRYKPEFRDSLPISAEWVAAYAAFRANSELTQRAIQNAAFYDQRLSPADSVQYAKIEALHAVIASHRSPAHFANALRTLETNGSTASRVIALLVIANFVDRDSAWWALADAQRDPMGIVTGTASQVLSAMISRSARPVDWQPMTDRLRYIVDGTNLFAFDGTLRMLAATSVSPTLAAPLLAGGGSILRAKLRSGNEWSKQAAVAFLAQISGLPRTSDVSGFERWINALDAGR